MDITLAVRRRDTFTYQGKYWTYHFKAQLPHDHPAYYTYGRGVEPDGTVCEVGIAPGRSSSRFPSIGASRTVCAQCYAECASAASQSSCRTTWSSVRCPGIRIVTRSSGTDVAFPRARKPRGAAIWCWPNPDGRPSLGSRIASGTGNTWCVPFGWAVPLMLVGDVDTVSRKLEDVSRHVKSNETFLYFGQGILDRDRCLRTPELIAGKVMPRFRE